MKLRVTASVLNLRSAPSASARIVGQALRGAEVKAVEFAPWRYVRLASGVEGWVHGDYVREAVEATPARPAWRVAKSLDVLLRQLNTRAPHRSKTLDGSLGDDAHAKHASDHNVNRDGVVLARDFTHDPAHGLDVAAVAESLRISQDKRIRYVIHAGRIFSSSVQPWKWRPYTGTDAHLHHMHLSVVPDPALYDDTRPWAV